MVNRTIIVLNGPPNSGKDVCAKYLEENDIGMHVEMKTKLIEIACVMADISERAWYCRYDNRELKEQPWDVCGGLSQRQFLIKISEEWVKPLFGKDYFGVMANNELMATPTEKVFIFSDGGFVEELKGLADKDTDLLIIRLHRPGADYSGDSRSYVDPSGLLDSYNNVTLRKLHNTAGLQQLLISVLALVTEELVN